MSDQFMRALASEQRRRAVGTILGYAETHIYPRLAEPERKAFREKVLGAIDTYHDLTLDMLKASANDSIIVNERALELLEAIHTNTRPVRVRAVHDG